MRLAAPSLHYITGYSYKDRQRKLNKLFICEVLRQHNYSPPSQTGKKNTNIICFVALKTLFIHRLSSQPAVTIIRLCQVALCLQHALESNRSERERDLITRTLQRKCGTPKNLRNLVCNLFIRTFLQKEHCKIKILMGGI